MDKYFVRACLLTEVTYETFCDKPCSGPQATAAETCCYENAGKFAARPGGMDRLAAIIQDAPKTINTEGGMISDPRLGMFKRVVRGKKRIIYLYY